jgi:hypothetical protein
MPVKEWYRGEQKRRATIPPVYGGFGSPWFSSAQQ